MKNGYIVCFIGIAIAICKDTGATALCRYYIIRISAMANFMEPRETSTHFPRRIVFDSVHLYFMSLAFNGIYGWLVILCASNAGND